MEEAAELANYLPLSAIPDHARTRHENWLPGTALRVATPTELLIASNRALPGGRQVSNRN